MKGARNPGVAACVKSNKNSVGYVDISDARDAGLTQFFARIGKTETVKKKGKRVRVARYILPSAGSGAKAGEPEDDQARPDRQPHGQPGPGRLPHHHDHLDPGLLELRRGRQVVRVA